VERQFTPVVGSRAAPATLDEPQARRPKSFGVLAKLILQLYKEQALTFPHAAAQEPA
jgi:hypothetical protein